MIWIICGRIGWPILQLNWLEYLRLRAVVAAAAAAENAGGDDGNQKLDVLECRTRRPTAMPAKLR